jgi:hypothetical protein
MRLPSMDELVSVSGEAIEHALNGDIARSRERLDRLRVLRSRTVATLKSSQQFRSSESTRDLSLAELSDKKLEAAEFEKNSLQIRAWLRSAISGLTSDELFRSDEGVDLYLDVFLPETWDFAQDIIVFHSSDTVRLIPRLKLRGQVAYLVLESFEDKALGDSYTDKLRSEHPDLSIVTWHPDDALESAGINTLMPASVSPTVCFLDPFKQKGDGDGLDRILAYVSHLSVLVNSAAHWPITFVENWLSQLPELASFPSIVRLKKEFQHRSVLIASPGPSLIQSLPEITKYRDRYLLLAPIRSLQTLFDADITPDFAIHVDATDFSEMMPRGDSLKDVSLICLEQAHQSVWGEAFKMIFVAPVLNTLGSPISIAFHGEGAVAGSGSCVSTLFAHIAVQLGAKSITLVGQDLSISKGGYASISQSQRADQLNPGRSRISAHLTCEGINGEELKTLPDYKQFIAEFEALRDQNASKAQFINATIHGAHLRGWEHTSLSNDLFVETLHDQSFGSAPYHLRMESEEVRDRLNLLLNALKNEEGLTASIGSVCLEISKEITHLLSTDGNDVTKLEVLEERLGGLTSSLGSIFKFYSLGCTSSLVAKSGSVISLKDNLLICLEYYSQLCDLAQQLGEALAAVSDRIQVKLN